MGVDQLAAILELYDDLGFTRSPVVAMNRAVAVPASRARWSGSPRSMHRGPGRPRSLSDAAAIQAELWREAGDVDRAVEGYRAALGLARSAPEQRWLTSGFRFSYNRRTGGIPDQAVALEPGAWEIQYIEEYFGEFPRRKTADEIITRLRDREAVILMAEAPLPDDPAARSSRCPTRSCTRSAPTKPCRSCATWSAASTAR